MDALKLVDLGNAVRETKNIGTGKPDAGVQHF